MIIVYVVDDAVVSDAEATCRASLELAALSRTRVFSEVFYRPHYSIVNRFLSFDDDLIAHRAA